MKRSLLIFSVVLAVLAAPLARADGDTLDSATLNAIKANCVTAQASIQRLQEADKPTRINRGYLYETLSKLMANFNSRVAQNKIDSPELLTITSDYEKQLKTFTSTYTTYDESLSSLTSIDCEANPSRFYAYLVQARQLRSSLNDSVVKLDGLLDNYQSNVNAVKKIVEAGL